MKHLILSLITLAFIFAGCLKESEDILIPDDMNDDQKITVLVFSNQRISHNQDADRYELLIIEEKITEEVLSEAEVNISLSKVDSESDSWTTIPANFSPNLATIAPVYFDVLLSTSQIIIISEERPDFEEVDVQIVIKEDE